jgi:hypothetical protein
MFRAIPSDERPIGPDDGQFLPKLVREVLPTTREVEADRSR